MERNAALGWVALAWVGAVGMITFRQVYGRYQAGPPKNLYGWLPAPSAYLGSVVLFTLLGGVALITPSLAVALAVGVDVALIAQPYVKGSRVGILDQAASLLDKVSPPPPTTGRSNP